MEDKGFTDEQVQNAIKAVNEKQQVQQASETKVKAKILAPGFHRGQHLRKILRYGKSNRSCSSCEFFPNFWVVSPDQKTASGFCEHTRQQVHYNMAGMGFEFNKCGAYKGFSKKESNL